MYDNIHKLHVQDLTVTSEESLETFSILDQSEHKNDIPKIWLNSFHSLFEEEYEDFNDTDYMLDSFLD